MKRIPFYALLLASALLIFAGLGRADEITSIPSNPDLVSTMPENLP